jgi:Flp pilus assembly protein TadD
MVRLTTFVPRGALWLAMAALLAACATSPGPATGGASRPAPSPVPRYPAPAPAPYPGSGPPPAQRPAPAPVPAPVPPAAPKPDPSVTLALREQSLAAAARGDSAGAIALIERALRIEPNRAELWIDLARLHLDEGDAAGAEQFARKALLFTRDRPDLEQSAYSLISEAQRTH